MFIRFFKHLSIRNKILFSYLFITLIPMLWHGFDSYQTIISILSEKSNKSLLNAANETSFNLDNFFRNSKELIKVSASMPIVKSFLEQNQNRSQKNRAVLLKTLNSIKEFNRMFIISCAVLDSDGNNVMDTKQDPFSKNESEYPYFYNTKKSSRPYISDLLYSSQEFEPSLFVCQGIYNDQHEFIGLLRIQYSASIIQLLVSNTQELGGDNSFAVLFNENGICLAHSIYPDLNFQPMRNFFVNNLSFDGQNEFSEFFNHLQGSKYNNSCQKLIFKFNSEVLYSCALVQTIHKPWFVLFLQPEHLFKQPVNQFAQRIIFTFILFILIVLFSAFIISKVITDPIQHLKNITQDISEGNLNRKVTVKNKDELGLLAQSFEKMRISVKNKIEDLHLEIKRRQKSELDLRESEKKYRELIEAMHDGMAAIDQDKKIIFVNRRFQEIIDDSEESLKGKNITQLISPKDVPVFEENFLNNLNGQALTYELELINQTCSNITGLISSRALIDEKGNVRAVLLIITDITERKNLEQRLFQTEKMNAIGQLAGGIAHDFNNLLLAIQGHAELLKNQIQLPEKSRKKLERIITASGRGAVLVQQLLNYARKGNYKSIELDLHSVIHDAIALLEHSISKNITITTSFKANNSIIMGDPASLEHAFLNLAINAKDAMPQGGHLQFITANQVLKNTRDEVIEIIVKDTGKGMDAKTQERIFEPFYTTKKLGEGTGMGLASVYGTVNLHHGTIEVNSALNIGSEFIMRFPVIYHEITKNKEEIDPVELKKVSGTIMIVDDQEDILDFLKLALDERGFEVIAFLDSLEALEHYKKYYEKIDLIILDLNMPKLDGTRLFREMRQINEKLEVVISTGYHQESAVSELLDQSIRDVLKKPFRIKELYQVISKYFH